MRKVLIISYYWPPAGGGGVQRWLKMSKYLHEGGWQPIIYTPSNAEVSGMDDSLVKEIHASVEVIRSPIWEPYDLYKMVLGLKKEEKIYSGFIQKDSKKPKWLRRLTQFIRGNFFIPDARRFWIRPGIKYLNEYLRNHKVDVIVSTGPPHTTHMIAMSVSKSNKLPWVADFRDPWTQIDFYKDLELTWFADKCHKYLEKKVLMNATKVVSVSSKFVDGLASICQRTDIETITNGYDHEDFKEIVHRRTDKFVICHMGSMNSDRDPVALWQVLSHICVADLVFAEKLEIALIGPVDSQIFESLEKYNLSKYLRSAAFVPHDEAIKQMKSAHLLLLCINNTDNQAGIIPGKMFEYLGSKRDIICIGPHHGDVIDILKKCQPNSVAHFENRDLIQKIVMDSYQSFVNNVYQVRNEQDEKYSRRALALQYGKLLDSII